MQVYSEWLCLGYDSVHTRLIHILLLSNSHNNVASIQKNWGDKSDRVIVALAHVIKQVYSYSVFVER